MERERPSQGKYETNRLKKGINGRIEKKESFEKEPIMLSMLMDSDSDENYDRVPKNKMSSVTVYLQNWTK